MIFGLGHLDYVAQREQDHYDQVREARVYGNRAVRRYLALVIKEAQRRLEDMGGPDALGDEVEDWVREEAMSMVTDEVLGSDRLNTIVHQELTECGFASGVIDAVLE